ncbi:MAG TPA: alpha/beta hydrolase [Pedobacter sp.]|nr:alpha/beta hydrolase [Pedobacter sp.]
MKFAGVVLMVLGFFGQVLTLSAKVRVERDVDYTSATGDVRRQLNIYHKTNVDTAQDVIIFIHGGSWSSGKKETYWWLGRNLARKGFVTAVINYGLAPDDNYEQMGADCAAAVSWVADHIAAYGGNPDRIFLMGHSAGAHLAELINSDPKYLKAAGVNRALRGLILNDPFGLDMHEYLSTAEKDADYYNFLRTFSDNPSVWTKGSPMNYLSNVHNPHLIFYGAKTYPAIQMQSERINKLLLAGKTSSELHVIGGKKHVGMISQMIFGCNKLYKYIEDFARRN